MNVWPFMFAASKTSDYQFVALPDFFDAGNCEALRERLEIDDTDPKRTRTATTSGKQAGSVSCVYRAGPIVVDNEIWTDSAGRKLLFAFGVVTKAVPAGPSLEKLLDVIDGSQPMFEKRLLSFLNADRKWTPLVTQAIKFPVEQEGPEFGKVRKYRPPTMVLLLALIINLGISAFLYSEIRSLESKLNAARSETRLDPVAAQPPKPDVANNPVAKAPETSSGSEETPPQPRAQELEKRGRLTIERGHQ